MMWGNDTDTLHGPMQFKKVVEQMLSNGTAPMVRPTASYFRPNTVLPIVKYAFVFQGAGMGDYIAYLPSVIWDLKNCPWMYIKLFVAEWFVDFAKNIFEPYKMLKVYDLGKINDLVSEDSFLRGPGVTMNGVKYSQLANGTGGHLVDTGFLYFCNVFPTPRGADIYPELKFSEHALPNNLLPKSYIVITPGAVSGNREVPGEAWNPIIEHARKYGIDTVVLGKSIKYAPISRPEGITSKVIDLWDQTSMLEAAWIMKNAACVIGLDNGLIQIASCTDVPIIAGYSMVHPDHRRPNRRSGKWREIFVSREELCYSGCQSVMKSMIPHTFNHCLYGDNKCIELMFKDNSARWCAALDSILEIDRLTIP